MTRIIQAKYKIDRRLGVNLGVVLNHHLTQEKLHLVNTAQEEKPTEFGIQLFANKN